MKKLFLILLLCCINIAARAQSYQMVAGTTQTATICGGNFYDDGGATGNYACCNLTSTYTFYPSIPGAKVSVVFSAFSVETCCDPLRLYNGNSTASPQIWSFLSGIPTSFTSTAADGSLTFQFYSDVSIVSSGWAATLSLVGGVTPITTQPVVSNTVCPGVVPTFSVGATGTVTYQWVNNGTTNSNAGGTVITGATNSSYTPVPSVTPGTTYYYCRVANSCGTIFPSNTSAVVVNTPPPAIAGTATVCPSNTTTLSNTATPGTWSSASPLVASISSSGVVTGLASGTSRITYTQTSTGCNTSTVVTVNTIPAAITGTMSMCQGGGTNLSSADLGGTWTSGSTGIATIGVSTGIVSGISAGLAAITYATPTSACIRTAQVTVNPLPAVTVTPPGPTTICNGNSTTFAASSPNPTFALLSQNFNAGFSGWTVTQTPAVPALPLNVWNIVNSTTSADGVLGDGSNMAQAMSYGTPVNTTLTSTSFSTVGYGAVSLIFNQYLLSTGLDAAAKIEYSVNGGTSWTQIVDQVGSVVGSTSWVSTAPETTISLPAGAIGQPDVRLRWNYNGTQFYWFLDNISVTATLPPSTYAWTGAAGLSCTTCTTPTITPTSLGVNNYSVTVTSSAGCTTTNGVTVSVNPLPGTISGSLAICVGSSFALTNSAAPGIWACQLPSIATIASGTGIITGVTPGTTTVTYTLPTGCSTTAVVTVVPAPAAIGGTGAVCSGQTTVLTHAITGGTWVCSSPLVASINSFGVLSGVAAGTAIVTYTTPSGCVVNRTVTVNATPALSTGVAVVCQGATTNLANITPGGTWSSATPSVATINGLGMVTGVSEGYSLMSYTISATGCRTTTLVTVNPLPSATGGATNVCVGSSAVVTNTTAGGTWSTVSPAIATINASGIITGMSAGNTVVSYILSGTGCGVASVFTVNALPSVITGPTELCKDELAGYAASPAGGTWTSSNPSVLTIDPSSGSSTAMSAGNATVSYTLPTGCRSTTNVLVNPLPQVITGTTVVCYGQTTNLYDFTPGGIWSSGNTSVASISPTGVVTGAGAGIAQITYMNATTGCQRTTNVTVNPLPGVITGTFDVCVGSTTSLGNPDFGGTWSSANNSIATVNSVTGVVTGVAAGNAAISYTLPTGCVRTQVITVNALPSTLSGSAAVCEGLTINWSSAPAGGTWSSDNNAIASVNASGVVAGNAAGTTTITYTLPTGCMRTRNIVVNTTPATIGGIASACVGQTSALSSLTGGGAWSTGSSAIAPVSSTGIVTGATAGTTNITYTLPTGCKTNTSFVVNPLPSAITGSLNVCEAASTTLVSATATSWSSANTAIATVDAAGVVSGVSAGTVSITCYTINGCQRNVTVTVNALPASMSGILNVCAGSTTALTSAPAGGTWSSSASGIATVNSAGVVVGVTNGTVNITYTLPTTCRRVASVVVNPMPADITGTTTVCAGLSSTLSNTAGGGNWSSSNPSIASVNAGGLMTGFTAGTVIVTYALPTGCMKTTAVLVNALPSAIVGNTTICEGSTTNLGSGSAGGSWISSDLSVATIGAGTGAVTGVNAGFSIITYTFPTGCFTSTSLVVNSLPAVITGTATVCAGSTTQLESVTGGGTWSSSASTATVNSTGIVSGIAAGTSVITYVTANNCKRSTIVTINPLPGLLAGTGTVCSGLTTVMSNANPGGVWTSDNTVVATIGASTGIINGNAAGTATITYTLPTGCMRSRMITVSPAVEAITGVVHVCTGANTTLSTATTGGAWLSSNTSVATVNFATGVVTGVGAGTAVITYTLPTGCMQLANVIVDPLPENITGAASVCQSSSIVLNTLSTGGSWASSNTSVATINASGVVTGVAAGSATMSYVLGTGCVKTKSVVVNALPVQFIITGGGSYCAGGTGVVVGLDSSATGSTYELIHSSATVSTLSGTGAPLSFGLHTVAGDYTISATNAAGCVRSMAGIASITINPLVVPSVTMTASASDTVCAGTSVTYTATGSNGGTTPGYAWSVGSSVVGTGTSYTYVPVNGDEVKITFTSSAVCPSVASVSVTKTMVVLPNLTPSVSITAADDTVCQGSLASFTAVSVNGGTAPAYIWIVNGSIVTGASASSYTYLPSNNQTIVCRLNSNYRCPSVNNVSSNTVTIRVNPQYIPVVNITAVPGTVAKEGELVTFTANVTGGGANPTYQWKIRGAAVAGATLSTFSSSDLNNGDSVTCAVIGTGECGLETINSIVMKITPTTGVGTTSITTGDIRMMPNPTNGTFTVSGTLGSQIDEQVSLEITDVLGQVVYRAATVARAGILNEQVQLSSSLANGMYMLNISNGNDRKVFHFVLKQ